VDNSPSSVDEESQTGDTVISIPRERAAKLAQVSLRRIDYWASTGLVTPSIDDRSSGQRRVRLYSFGDLLELLVAAELVRTARISLQNVRSVVEALRGRRYPRPLRQLKFAVVGDKIYVQLEDGDWIGGRAPGQMVIHQVMNLEPLRAKIHEAAKRDPEAGGRIARRRGVLGSQPVLADTRIPVATIRQYLSHGFDEARIMASFPALTPADLDAVRSVVA